MAADQPDGVVGPFRADGGGLGHRPTVAAYPTLQGLPVTEPEVRAPDAVASDVSHAFNPYLHGARGLFALMIVVFHVVNSGLPTFGLVSHGWPLLAQRSLEFGVELFFGISGIVIFGALQRARGPPGLRRGARDADLSCPVGQHRDHRAALGTHPVPEPRAAQLFGPGREPAGHAPGVPRPARPPCGLVAQLRAGLLQPVRHLLGAAAEDRSLGFRPGASVVSGAPCTPHPRCPYAGPG